MVLWAPVQRRALAGSGCRWSERAGQQPSPSLEHSKHPAWARLPSFRSPDPQVEKELQDICNSILQLLDEHLIHTASTGESRVFYLKMKGDYHRYLAEFKTGAERKEAAEHTLLAYKAAQVRAGRGGVRAGQGAQRRRASCWVGQ